MRNTVLALAAALVCCWPAAAQTVALTSVKGNPNTTVSFSGTYTDPNKNVVFILLEAKLGCQWRPISGPCMIDGVNKTFSGVSAAKYLVPGKSYSVRAVLTYTCGGTQRTASKEVTVMIPMGCGSGCCPTPGPCPPPCFPPCCPPEENEAAPTQIEDPMIQPPYLFQWPWEIDWFNVS